MVQPQGFWSALLATLVCLVPAGEAAAQVYPRAFQMSVWNCCGASPTNLDQDVASFSDGYPQPPGRSIMFGFDWSTPVSARHYDWSRILAVENDEPFTSVGGSPCASINYNQQFSAISNQLAARASELAKVAPLTRFWVNFTPREVGWMKGGCSMVNQAYMDVVSEDRYYDYFYPTVEPDYDWLVSHPATPYQQVALVPGTFYRPGHDDPSRQADILDGYFAYAFWQNQTCNLPRGPRGITGSYDGCPVWIVFAWLSGNWTDPKDGTNYVGEVDPRLADTVTAAWRAQVAVPLRPGLDHQLSRGQIVELIQMLDQ